jgi:HK97 family phage prohead protease/HK97 family phage major capsid protein
MEGLVYRTAKQSAADPAEYVLSDETVDRMGEVIAASGWDLSNFGSDRNPIALFNHHSDAIIGRWEKVRVEGKRLLGRLVLADEGTDELVDKVRKLWKQGILRAVSVGFRPLEKQKLNEKSDDYFGPFRYLRQELVECSLVAVPANPNALQVSRAFELPVDIQRQIFGKSASQDRLPGSTASRVPAQPHSASRGSPMRLSKKIEDAQKRINSLKDQLTALSNKDNPGEDDVALMDELPNQIEDADAELQRNLRIEGALATRTIDHDPNEAGQQRGDDQRRPFAVPAKKIEPVDYMLRSAIVTALAYHQRKSLEQVLRERYGNDEATGIVLRAAVDPAKTTVVGWAAELVQTVTDGFLNTLFPLSVYARLRAMSVSLSFDRAGIIKIPARSATPQINGDFVGEGAPIPVRRLGLTSIQLTPKKVAVLTEFTEEMADHSTPQIEGLLREAISEDTAVILDTRLLDINPATTVRPAGLRNGVAGLTPSALTNPSQAMVADLKALIAALTAVNGGRRVAILVNTAQSFSLSMAQTVNGDFLFGSAEEASRKFGVTFIASNNVPAGVVIAVDTADFVTVSGDTPNFDMSNQATIHEEDTTPLPITDAAGVAAKPVRSLWQTDSMALRMRMPVNWAMRRQNMVAWMTGVLW